MTLHLNIQESPSNPDNFFPLSEANIELLNIDPLVVLKELAFESPTEKVIKVLGAELLGNIGKIEHRSDVDKFKQVNIEIERPYAFGNEATGMERITNLKVVIRTEESSLVKSPLDDLSQPIVGEVVKIDLLIGDLFFDPEQNAQLIGLIKKALRRENVFSFSELENLGEKKFGSLGGIGPKAIEYTKECMKRHNLKFKDSD